MALPITFGFGSLYHLPLLVVPPLSSSWISLVPSSSLPSLSSFPLSLPSLPLSPPLTIPSSLIILFSRFYLLPPFNLHFLAIHQLELIARYDGAGGRGVKIRPYLPRSDHDLLLLFIPHPLPPLIRCSRFTVSPLSSRLCIGNVCYTVEA